MQMRCKNQEFLVGKNAHIPHNFSVNFISDFVKQRKKRAKLLEEIKEKEELRKAGKDVEIPDPPEVLPTRIYKDTSHEANGLMLRVSPQLKLTYVVHGRIKAEGKAAQFFTIGNGDMMLSIARRQAAKFKSWMAQGLHPTEAQNRKERTFTLRELFEKYLETKGVKSAAKTKGLQQDTIDEYKKQFNRLSHRFQTRNALKITKDDVIKEHNWVAEEHTDFMSDKTFQLVGAIFRNAMKIYSGNSGHDQVVQFNPVKVLNDTDAWKVNGGQSRRRAVCIDTEHMPDVYRAIEEMKDYKDGIKYIHKQTPSAVVAAHFFRFMLFTGWRPEEACKMTWSQVADDFKDVTWNDSEAAATLKGGEEQYRAPLNTEAQATLKSLKEYNYGTDWVFPNMTQTNHFGQNPTLYVDLLTKLANTGERYTAGIFRKTFQTYAEHINVHPVTIKRLVFHTQKYYNTQGGYIFANRENLRRQSQRVCDFILLHSKKANLAKSQQVQVDIKYVEAALAVVNDESQKYELVSEVLEHWIKTGMAIDQFKFDK
jgi:hypothetical protein